MIERRVISPKVFLIGLGLLLIYYLARDLPGKQTMVLGYLAGLVALALILFGYENWCFPLMIMTFFWAGLNVPLNDRSEILRWAMLAVAAGGGIMIWMFKGQRLEFRTFHLIAMVTVFVFLFSTPGSVNPLMTFLKVSTLALLFFYGTIGARISYRNKEGVLLRHVALACEASVYISAFFYKVVNYPFYGNPNSLGAVMGVIVWPMLVWSLITERTGVTVVRKVFALALCGLLLYQSFSRAGMATAMVSGSMVLMYTYRHKIFRLGVICVTLGALTAFICFSDYWKKPVMRFIYKGTEKEIFQSRRDAWSESIEIAQESRFVGVGFGVAKGFSEDWKGGFSSKFNMRESGSGYLALLEGVGVVGCVPFAILLVLLLKRVWWVRDRMRRIGNPADPSLPMAAVVTGGLFHALFEDWITAVGYYLCVLFWFFAFLLVEREDGIRVFKRHVRR